MRSTSASAPSARRSRFFSFPIIPIASIVSIIAALVPVVPIASVVPFNLLIPAPSPVIKSSRIFAPPFLFAPMHIGRTVRTNPRRSFAVSKGRPPGIGEQSMFLAAHHHHRGRRGMEMRRDLFPMSFPVAPHVISSYWRPCWRTPFSSIPSSSSTTSFVWTGFPSSLSALPTMIISRWRMREDTMVFWMMRRMEISLTPFVMTLYCIVVCGGIIIFPVSLLFHIILQEGCEVICLIFFLSTWLLFGFLFGKILILVHEIFVIVLIIIIYVKTSVQFRCMHFNIIS